MSEIHIMCGGPSATNTKMRHPMIAVNRDIERYTNAEYFLTCDISFSRYNADLIKNFKGTRVFINNLDQDRIDKHQLLYFDLIINTTAHKGFKRTFRDFGTGTNSGFSAVQFAIIMGYTTIHMYGIDLIQTNNSHWHKGYGHGKSFLDQRLFEFFTYFKEGISAASDIKFISHSNISKLNGLPNVIHSKIS